MKHYQAPESIDMTDFLNEVSKETPQESVIFIEKSLAIVNIIFNILERKSLKQKDFAFLLGKSEAEIRMLVDQLHAARCAGTGEAFKPAWLDRSAQIKKQAAKRVKRTLKATV